MNNKVISFRVSFKKIRNEWFSGINLMQFANLQETRNTFNELLSAYTKMFFRKNTLMFDSFLLKKSNDVKVVNNISFDNIVHIGPHSDDVCSAISYLNAQKNLNAQVTSSVFCADHLGVNYKHADFFGLNQKNLVFSAEKLRMHEFDASCRRFGFQQLDVPYDYFKPQNLVLDHHDRVISDLSDFMCTYNEHHKLEKTLIEGFFQRESSLLLLPFILDRHPVHRHLAKIIMSLIADNISLLPSSSEIWMYSTGDILNDFQGNRFFSYKDDGLKKIAWSDYQSQLKRVPAYPRYWVENDYINARKIPFSDTFAEMFIKVDIEPLK